MAESLAGEQAIQQVTMMLHIIDGVKYWWHQDRAWRVHVSKQATSWMLSPLHNPVLSLVVM